MKLTITLVLSLAMLCGCAQQSLRVIGSENIQERDHLVYEVSASFPLTGGIAYQCGTWMPFRRGGVHIGRSRINLYL